MRANLFKGGVLAATLALCVAAVPWTVNVGTTPNDGTGDPARTAFNKINSNFVYVGTNLWSPTNARVAGYVGTTDGTNDYWAAPATGSGGGLSRVQGNTNANTWFEIGAAGLVPNIETNGVGLNATNVINLPTTDATHSGILASNDWQAFTGKQASNAVLASVSNTRAMTNVVPTFGVRSSDILYPAESMVITNVFAFGAFSNFSTLYQEDVATFASDVSINAGGNLAVQGGAVFNGNLTAGGAFLTTNGNTLFVDALAGNDSLAMRGRSDRPWRGLSNAVWAAQNGDTVVIRPGQYTNTLVYSNAYGHAVRLIGKTNVAIVGSGWGSEVYGLGTGSHLLISNCSGINLDRFSIIGSKGAGSSGASLVNGLVAAVDIRCSDNVTVERMRFKNHVNHGVSCISDIGDSLPPKNVTVRYCYFENGGATSGVPSLTKDGPAIQITGDNWSVYGNVITNWARGVEFYSNVQDLRNAVVTRNSILWVPWEGICPVFNFKLIGAKITDNYIEGEQAQALASGTSGIVMTGNGAESCNFDRNTILRFQQGNAMIFQPTIGAGATFRGNTFNGNIIGECQTGITIQDADAHNTNLCNNTIVLNNLRGIGNDAIRFNGVGYIVANNIISHFGTNTGAGRGVFSLAAPFVGTNRANQIINNAITDGPVGIELLGANVISNRLDGNYIARCTTAITDAGTGTIKGSASTVRVGTASGLDGYGAVSTGLGFSGTTLSVTGNSTTQKVDVVKNSGAVVSSRNQLNFIEGANVTLTVADDSGNGQTDITIAGSAGGSMDYDTASVTNYDFLGTNRFTMAAGPPTGGAAGSDRPVWEAISYTNNSQSHARFGLYLQENANVVASSTSNRVWSFGFLGDEATQPKNVLRMENRYHPSGVAPRTEIYFTSYSTNGLQDRRWLMFEAFWDGSYAGPYLRGNPTFQNMDATTNLLELRGNFAHTMIASTLSINGVDAGRADVRFRNRGFAGFFNTDNSLSYGIGGYDDEKSLMIFGNNTGATNVVITNFNAGTPMILQIPKGGLEIGPGSATVTNILIATASLDFPSTGASTNSDLGITVTGATTNDFPQLCVPFQAANAPHISYSCFMSNDTVWVRFTNNRTNAAVDPAIAVFRAMVTKVR